MEPESSVKFERYSDDIRSAMRIANREAIRHLHPHIDTPHLLIALVRERTGLGGAVLRRAGLTARRVRRAVRRAFPRLWFFNVFAKLPLSAYVDTVVEAAVEHAIAGRHDSVGTGAILLVMLRHDAPTAAVLRSLGVDVTKVERELSKYLHRFMVEAPGQTLHFDAPPDSALP